MRFIACVEVMRGRYAADTESEDMIQKTTIENVLKAKTPNQWTQNDLAIAIGIRESHLNRILNGHVTPQVSVIVKIAQALGLKVEDIWVTSPEPKAA